MTLIAWIHPAQIINNSVAAAWLLNRGFSTTTPFRLKKLKRRPQVLLVTQERGD